MSRAWRTFITDSVEPGPRQYNGRVPGQRCVVHVRVEGQQLRVFLARQSGGREVCLMEPKGQANCCCLRWWKIGSVQTGPEIGQNDTVHRAIITESICTDCHSVAVNVPICRGACGRKRRGVPSVVHCECPEEYTSGVHQL